MGPKIFYVDPPTALIGVHKSQIVTLVNLSFGSFTLTEIDSGTHSDSDSRLNGYIGLYRTFHIAQTRTWIPTPDFCTGQGAESESTPESISCNVNEPLDMNGTSVNIIGCFALIQFLEFSMEFLRTNGINL